MKPLLVLTSLLLVTLAGLAQNAKQAAKIDSLRRVIATTRVDTVKGRTLCRLCGELRKIAKYEEGLAAGEQGLEISRKVGDRRGEARCSNDIGTCFLSQGNLTNALEYYKQSIEIAEKIGDQATMAKCLNNMATSYRKLGDYSRAHEYYQQGLKLAESLGDLLTKIACLNGIGNIHIAQNNYDQALLFFMRSYKISSEPGYEAEKAKTLLNIGNICFSKSDYPRALEAYEQSKKLFEELADQASLAACLNNIANLYTGQGQYALALEYYRKGSEILNQIGNKEGLANSLQNIGNTYNYQGDYLQALNYYLQSLKLNQEIRGDETEESLSCYSSISCVYIALKDYNKAQANLLNCIKISEKIGSKKWKALAIGNLGIIYDQTGNYSRALDCYQRALAIFEKIESWADIQKTVSNIGSLYAAQANYSESLKYFRRSLKICEGIQDASGLAFNLHSIGKVYLGLGRTDSAKVYAQKGLVLAKEIGSLENQRSTCQLLYQIDSTLGNWKSALSHYQLYRQYDDSLRYEEKSREFGRLEAKWEAEQKSKQREIQIAQERAEERAENQNLLTTAAIILLLLGALTFTQVRHRRRQRRAYTQLEVLFGQLAEQKAIIEEQNTNLARQSELLAQQNLHLQLAYEDLKLEQEARMQAQRLAGIGEISAIIAHEVNTPLGAIVGGVENLMQRIFDHAAELEGIQPERREELRQNLSLAAAAAPLSSREERAAIRQYEAQCAAVGFPDPEAAARLIVQSGLREAANERTLRWAAERPTVFRYLVNISQQLSQLATIRRAAQQATGTITILRAYTQQSTAQQADACPVETLRLVLKLYDYHLNQGIHLELDAPENPPRVVLDASSLIQIWTKLLLFSMYGMRKHGLLRIRFEVGAGSLQVFWSDNGPQPDADLLAQAFEPGTNLRQTEPAVGLWLCRSLLENQGGSIGIGINEQHELTINCWMPLSRQ